MHEATQHTDTRPAPRTLSSQAAANSKIKSRAEYLLEEQQDEVKHMNQMLLYSKCVTIRDAQIEEKKQMMLEAEEENRRQDLLMEIERLKVSAGVCCLTAVVGKGKVAGGGGACWGTFPALAAVTERG